VYSVLEALLELGMWYLQEYVQVISLIKLPFRGKDSNNSRQ
jgi:hypothetical protein